MTVSPALNFVDAVAAMWGLCATGRARADGGPGLRHGVLLAEAFRDDIELCSPPRWVQRMAVAALAPLIRATGRAVDTAAVLQAAIADPGGWPGPITETRSSGPLTTPTEV